MENRRAHFRVRFPPSRGPVFHADGLRVLVLDCSSLGMRVLLADEMPVLGLGDRVAGRLDFGEGQSIDVQGNVVRVASGSLAISFAEGHGVPLSFVLREEGLQIMRRTSQPGQGRTSFRFTYPRKVSPLVHAELWSAPVRNCSESGLYCLKPISGEAPSEGAMARGVVAFNEGRVLRVAGTVLRTSPSGFALHLHPDSGLPLPLILAEERFVRSKFIQPSQE
ncbi:MAG: PilZ domain-containing protein [Longimicrobiales bacterium]|nr:PilZ domain-containing protein [Longimicrobiales bacterium]